MEINYWRESHVGRPHPDCDSSWLSQMREHTERLQPTPRGGEEFDFVSRVADDGWPKGQLWPRLERDITCRSFIYAELLSNIRQISVLAALSTPSDSSTTISLSDDGNQIILSHAGQTLILELPGQCCTSFQLQKPIPGCKEPSWRLPLASRASNAARVDDTTFDAPWSAKIMGKTTELSCRSCGEIVLKEGSIKVWKDLPSEDWAEIMDFWHCHKPHDRNEGVSNDCSNDHSTSTNAMMERGYGANSKFAAQPGVGFVDFTTFLLDFENCIRILTEQTNPEVGIKQPIRCAQCQIELGYHDPELSGIKLLKWRLHSSSALSAPSKFEFNPISSPSNSTHSGSSFLAPIFITAKILSKMTSQMVSRFLLMPQTAPEHRGGLILWILGPSIRFSCSVLPLMRKPGVQGLPASKVFWKEVSEDTANGLRDKVDIEELLLPPDALNEMEATLKNNAVLLPPSSRRYLDWNVGLLERYEE